MSIPILYVHGGSGNHGCEAIVRTMVELMSLRDMNDAIVLAENIVQDKKVELDKIVHLLENRPAYSRKRLSFIWAYLMNFLFKKFIYLDMLPCKLQIQRFDSSDVAIAIGGDTYSYKYSEDNTYMHDLFRKKGMKTVLWGCSIEPELLDDCRVLKDIKNFDKIVARETITYQSLISHGVKNVYLVPDTAFILKKKNVPLPLNFIEGKTVGINVSPMIIDNEKTQGMTLKNYQGLIEYILSNTNLNIALIPHVVWSNNDDRKPLRELHERYKDSNRISMIEDCNAEELKGYISRCRFMVAARTHASIAAYSSLVPTLVVGYSVKARGIAHDLFGNDEHYVIPVQELNDELVLTNAFVWMYNNEAKIRDHYQRTMPSYIQRVYDSSSLLWSKPSR